MSVHAIQAARARKHGNEKWNSQLLCDVISYRAVTGKGDRGDAMDLKVVTSASRVVGLDEELCRRFTFG